MEVFEMGEVVQADVDLAELVTSAANVVSNGGYYEIDTDAVAQVLAAHRAGGQTGIAAVLNALLDSCGARGTYHAIKYSDAVEAAEAALNPTQQTPHPRNEACRFGGVSYTAEDLAVAQRAACAIVPLYGSGDHGEQEAAQSGRLWNDHPAVQGALRALHEQRQAFAAHRIAGQAELAAVVQQCAIVAAIHSQYPIETDEERGYAAGRKAAAEAIRASSESIVARALQPLSQEGGSRG